MIQVFYISYVVCLYMNARNICYFGIWMMFVIVYYKQMHKWLKLYEYSIYQFVEEKKNIGCLCKNIMHIMSYEYIHIYYYLVRSKNTVFNINKCLILLFQTQWIFFFEFCMHVSLTLKMQMKCLLFMLL